MTSGLRKRARSYLNVPSATVNDGRLSFKARGILVYLLDKPAGWDVRSVSIAAESDTDGKAAVQAGLRELARLGYYRIEHRRLQDGRLVTGTAVSEEHVASWASEYGEYQGPVPVVQQQDGTFKVRHKDGSLTGDGFTAGSGPEPYATRAAGDGDVSAGRTGTQFSGAGSAGSGQTGAGSAGSGKLGAFTNTEEPLQKHIPVPAPSAPEPAHAGADAPTAAAHDEQDRPSPGSQDDEDGSPQPRPAAARERPATTTPESEAKGPESAQRSPGPASPPAATGWLPLVGTAAERAPGPAAAASADTPTAQTILRSFIDWDRASGGQLTRRTIGQLAKQLADLLDQGVGDRPIRRGLADWRASGQHPSTLDSFVNAAMNGGAPTVRGRASPNGHRPSTTNAAALQAIDAGRRVQAMFDGESHDP